MFRRQQEITDAKVLFFLWKNISMYEDKNMEEHVITEMWLTTEPSYFNWFAFCLQFMILAV